MILRDDEWTVLRLSVGVAAAATVVMLPVGLALGWLLARRSFRGKAALDALVHLPLVVPPVVTGYLLLLLLGRRGWVGQWLHEGLGLELAFTWHAAVLAAALMGLPLLVRTIRLSLETADLRLEDAARNLGAGPMRVWCTVTLPLALPGILAGLLLAFARGLGEFGATVTFAGNIAGETRTLPLAIYTATQTPGGDAAATRLVAISIALALAAVFISEWMARRVRRALGLVSEAKRDVA